MTKPDSDPDGYSSANVRNGPSRLVMVVDDDPEIRSMIRRILAKEYEVIALESGEEFLEMVQVYQPDLIMLDIRLPGRDGFKLCRGLHSRATFRRIPVIFLTGLRESIGFLRSLKAAGSAYLVKPFDPRELRGIIERLLEATPL